MVSEVEVQRRLDMFDRRMRILRGVVNGSAVVFALALMLPAVREVAPTRANLFVFQSLALLAPLIVIVSLLTFAREIRTAMACTLQVLSALGQLAALLVSVYVAFNAFGPVWTLVSLAVCIFPVFPLAIAGSMLYGMNQNAVILLMYGGLWLGSYFLSRFWLRKCRAEIVGASDSE